MPNDNEKVTAADNTIMDSNEIMTEDAEDSPSPEGTYKLYGYVAMKCRYSLLLFAADHSVGKLSLIHI